MWYNVTNNHKVVVAHANNHWKMWYNVTNNHKAVVGKTLEDEHSQGFLSNNLHYFPLNWPKLIFTLQLPCKLAKKCYSRQGLKNIFKTILWLCSLSVSTQNYMIPKRRFLTLIFTCLNYIFTIIFDTQRVTELLALLHVIKPFIIY